MKLTASVFENTLRIHVKRVQFDAVKKRENNFKQERMEQIMKADYAQAVKVIKQAIVVCRYRAARQMNGEVLGLYYSIGKYISEQSRNAQWGTNAIQTISDQLQQELPGLKGFSETNIKKMRLFYEAWAPVFEIRSAVSAEFEPIAQTTDIQPFTFWSTVSAEIKEEDLKAFISVSFSHHHAIFTKTKDINERWFYIRKCAQEFWGYRRLEQALRDISKPMGVATYRSVDELPDTYKALPSAEELRKLL